jgi:hypothetical protein
MMNLFRFFKRATKMIFHDSSMSKNTLFVFRYLVITIFAITTRAIGIFNTIKATISMLAKIMGIAKSFYGSFFLAFINGTYRTLMINDTIAFVKENK